VIVVDRDAMMCIHWFEQIVAESFNETRADDDAADLG
jgi:hypothetical protein